MGLVVRINLKEVTNMGNLPDVKGALMYLFWLGVSAALIIGFGLGWLLR